MRKAPFAVDGHARHDTIGRKEVLLTLTVQFAPQTPGDDVVSASCDRAGDPRQVPEDQADLHRGAGARSGDRRHRRSRGPWSGRFASRADDLAPEARRPNTSMGAVEPTDADNRRAAWTASIRSGIWCSAWRFRAWARDRR